jgi:peptidoglycan hydrolase CwlO-like protein
MQRTIIGLFILLVAGCATTDDPRQGGLFSYNPGAYEARLEQRHQNLAALQENQQQEAEQARQLESDVQIRQAMLERERERLHGLDADLVRLQQNINQYQARTNAQQGEKQRLGREIKRLQGQIGSLRNNQQLAQVEKEKQIASIQREINELSKLTLQLTQ